MRRIKGNPDKDTMLVLPRGKGFIFASPREALETVDEVAVLNNCFGIIYRKDSRGRIISFYIDGWELLRY